MHARVRIGPGWAQGHGMAWLHPWMLPSCEDTRRRVSLTNNTNSIPESIVKVKFKRKGQNQNRKKKDTEVQPMTWEMKKQKQINNGHMHAR